MDRRRYRMWGQGPGIIDAQYPGGGVLVIDEDLDGLLVFCRMRRQNQVIPCQEACAGPLADAYVDGKMALLG